MEKGMAGDRVDGDQVEPVAESGVSTGAAPDGGVSGVVWRAHDQGEASDTAIDENGGAVTPPTAPDFMPTSAPAFDDARVRRTIRPDETADDEPANGPAASTKPLTTRPPAMPPAASPGPAPDATASTPSSSPPIELPTPPPAGGPAAPPQPTAGPASAEPQATLSPTGPGAMQTAPPPPTITPPSPMPGGSGTLGVGPPTAPIVVPEGTPTGIRKYVYIKGVGRVRYDRLTLSEREEYLRRQGSNEPIEERPANEGLDNSTGVDEIIT